MESDSVHYGIISKLWLSTGGLPAHTDVLYHQVTEDRELTITLHGEWLASVASGSLSGTMYRCAGDRFLIVKDTGYVMVVTDRKRPLDYKESVVQL